MLRPIIPLKHLHVHPNPLINKGIKAFFQALESRFGIHIVRDSKNALLDDPELLPLSPLITSLRQSGVIQDVRRTRKMHADEPRMYAWNVPFSDGIDDIAGGSSVTSEYDALIAALAEALERHLWRFETDYFDSPRKGTVGDVGSEAISLTRFAGFSPPQRREMSGLRITDETVFLWIHAESLVHGGHVYIPAQTISGRHFDEPLVRPIITTGLATHETREKALLAGALEVLERDAYMITWLNKVSPPRIDLTSLAQKDNDVASILAQTKRYHLVVDVIHLMSDAPAYTTLAVIRDTRGSGVPIVIGLASGTRLGKTVAHAIAEGLRIRRNFRDYWLKRIKPAEIKKENIRHEEHGLYWLAEGRPEQLAFLTAGALEAHREAAWEHDSPEEHLERIISWCKEKGYEFLAVNMGRSEKNSTSLHVYNVVIPEMQPMHLVEKLPAAYGARLIEVPRALGFTPREKPFTEEPHPFV